jgi:hypothetical protein
MTEKIFLIHDAKSPSQAAYYVAKGLFERPADWYSPRDQRFLDGPLPLDWATASAEQIAKQQGLDFLPWG